MTDDKKFRTGFEVSASIMAICNLKVFGSGLWTTGSHPPSRYAIPADITKSAIDFIRLIIFPLLS